MNNFMTGFFLGNMLGNRNGGNNNGPGGGGFLQGIIVLFGLVAMAVVGRFLYDKGIISQNGAVSILEIALIPFMLEYKLGITTQLGQGLLHVAIGYAAWWSMMRLPWNSIGTMRVFTNILYAILLPISLINFIHGGYELLEAGFGYVVNGRII